MGGLLSPVVVGRATELEVLSAALDAAVSGSGATVVVTGEAGVGKSRLLREVRRIGVGRVAVALVGRAAHAATPVPFRPIAEALLAAHRVGPVGDDPEVVPFRTALGRLVPAWSAGSSTERTEVTVLHVAEGFLRVARSCARSGQAALVLLDDLHWADAETLAVVEYLADNVAAEPVLVVAAARHELGERPVRALIALADRRAARLLRLPRLTADEAVEMTRGCLGDVAVPAEVLQLVAEQADGIPFFVEELLAGLCNDGALARRGGRWLAHRPGAHAPTSFAESVRHRLASLSGSDQDLLLDAALLGRRIDPDLLAEVNGADRQLVDHGLRAGVGQVLIEVHELGFRFRHTLTRDALLAELLPGERAFRAANALDKLRGARPDLARELVEVAADLAQTAGRLEEAAALFLELGRRALAQGALFSAESAQRRAQSLATGTALELDATEALVHTLGLAGRADEIFELGEVLLARLADAAEELDPDGARRRWMHLSLARAAVAGTDWALAGGHLEAARGLGSGEQLELAARLDALGSVIAIGEGRLDDANRLAAAAVVAAEGSGVVDLLCEALLVHGRCARVRDLEVAERVFDRARILAENAGLSHLRARALTEQGSITALRGEVAQLLDARRVAQACGAPETEAVTEHLLGVAAWVRCDVEALSTHATAALRLARRYQLGLLVPAALILRACAHAFRGDRVAMEAALAEAEPPLGNDATQRMATHAHARGVCALAHDDLATAATQFAMAAEIARVERPTMLVPLVGMDVLMRALEGADPAPLAAQIRDLGAELPVLAPVLVTAEALALGRVGDGSTATAMIDSALGELRINPFVQAVVTRLVAPVAAAQDWGDPKRWLRAALTTFEVRALTEPARACRRALNRLGARVSRHHSGVISARESEVLGLIAEGLPNREIAAQLFLSHRTVEKHVERLLAKTGLANRAQLATYRLRQRADT